MTDQPISPSFEALPSDFLVQQDDGETLQRVLLITDRARERHVLMSALDALPVASAFASSRADALRLADSLRPDVVAVDVELGGEEGWLICEELLERAGTKPVETADIAPWDTVFIVLYGSAEGVEERARKNGLDQMLRWPFAVDEARSLLDLALDRSPAHVYLEGREEPAVEVGEAGESMAGAERAGSSAESPTPGSFVEAALVEKAPGRAGPEIASWDLTEIGSVRVAGEQVEIGSDLPPAPGLSSKEPAAKGEANEIEINRRSHESPQIGFVNAADFKPDWADISVFSDASKRGSEESRLEPSRLELDEDSVLIERVLVEADLDGDDGAIETSDDSRNAPDQARTLAPEDGDSTLGGTEDADGRFVAGFEQESSGNAASEDVEPASQEALSPILSDLFSVDGVTQVMLVENGGGVVFTSSKTPQFSLTQLAGHSGQMFETSNVLLGGARHEGHEGSLETNSIVVEGENCCILLQRLDSRHRLVVCVQNAAGLGQVRFLIRRLLPRLQRALRPG